MKKLISIFVAISLLIFVIMFSGCSERMIKSYNHCNKICHAMVEGNDEEFLRLVNNTKYNLNQYNVMPSLLPSIFDGIENTPLQKACYLENPYYVEKLLENGADPNYPKLKGNDRMLLPLAVAVRYMGVESGKRKEDTALIIEMLLEHGADPNIEMLIDKKTPLIRFASVDPEKYNKIYKELIVLLVEHGADKHAKDKYGKTAYDYAVYYGREELYDLLKP